MKDSSICVSAGKSAGSVYRSVAEKSQKVGAYLCGAAKSVAQEAQAAWLRMENFFKTIKTDTQLAHWEMKRKDDFAALGEELYRRKEAELEQFASDEEFKSVLSRVKEDQLRIRLIEEARQAQHKRMRAMTILKHATSQLDSPDARIRRAALRVLEKLNLPQAIPHISRLIYDSDEEVSSRARKVLRKFTQRQETPSDEEAADSASDVQEAQNTQGGSPS